jgi:hypothetical protein
VGHNANRFSVVGHSANSGLALRATAPDRLRA